MTRPSRIVPLMKRLGICLVLLVAAAVPAFAQSSEFGILFGGSARYIKGSEADSVPGTERINEGFSLSNSAIELYYGVELDPGTMFRIKAGRINTPVAVAEDVNGTTLRHDVRDGELQHIEGVVDYRFSEPFGSTGLFGGIGFYRQEAPGFSSTSTYGFNAGVNLELPISRRYGVIAEGTYHWTRQEFRPRFLTLTAGLRIAF